MNFTDAQYTQLIVALTMGLACFVLAYAVSPRKILPVLLVTLPFQPIMSKYGSVNMVLIYLIGGALMLRGRIRHWPLLGPVVVVLFAYALSFSQAPPATYFDNALYMITLGANFLLFYMVYNYVIAELNDPRDGLKILIWTSVAVVGYCALQFVAGFERMSAFGIDEFTLTANLEEKRRLVGPFNAAGINGAFFAMQLPLISFCYLYAESRLGKLFLITLLGANFAILVATGSRGSFLSGVGGMLLFFWVFSRRVGVAKVLPLLATGVAVSVVAAAVVITQTEFNVLFERLQGTEVRGYVPDTRAETFKQAAERIPEKMVIGHGPRLRLLNEFERRIPGHKIMGYPHNLYLFLLYTLGTVGLLAYLGFFLALTLRWLRARSYSRRNLGVLDQLPSLSLVLFIIFLVDELKIEFLRVQLADFQNYLFAFWAMTLGYATILIRERSGAQADGASELRAPNPLAYARRTGQP